MRPLSTPPRALILGIDGGSLDLIEPLIAVGDLPVLGDLLATSAYGPTSTTWPAHTAPGWATFVTGRQPGGHGIYQFFDTQAADYGDRIVGTADFGCTTVWDWLARQGLSVGLINVPMSHPPRPIPGYQLTWPLTKTLRYSDPPELLGELARAGAGFAPDIAAMFQGDHAYLDFAVNHVLARGRSITYLLRERPVDIVMAVITEIDRICHHYWHFGDACHPRHETPDRAQWSDAIKIIYRAIDQVFGEFLELVGDEVPVMVVSDHGFGAGRYNLAVNAMLAEAGLLATRPADGPAGDSASWFYEDGRVVDFTRTRAYMPTPGSYAVNVNLAGRQREGIVTRRDAGRVLDEVAELFLTLRAPKTGQPVFGLALPRQKAYPGIMSAAAPDLLLIPADEGVLAVPASNGPVWRPSEQTGMHRYAGMWAMRATGLPARRHDTPVRLVDLAPTLLAELGLRFPAGIDGGPLHWQLPGIRPEPVFLAEDQPAGGRAGAPSRNTDCESHLSDDEVTARTLSAMGYL